MRGGREIAESCTLPSRADDLRASLETMVRGFADAAARAGAAPAAITFAFSRRAGPPPRADRLRLRGAGGPARRHRRQRPQPPRLRGAGRPRPDARGPLPGP